MIFHSRTEEQIHGAINKAFKEKYEMLDLEQILLNVSFEPEAEKALEACGANIKRLRKNLESFIQVICFSYLHQRSSQVMLRT